MPLLLLANGVVTRSVRDTAAFYREAERVHRNPKLPPIGDVTHPNKRRLRIAVCTQSITRDASPEVRGLTLETAALLEELGHRVEPVDDGSNGGRLVFAYGTGTVRPEGSRLVLEAAAPDADSLAHVEDVLARHLERFGARRELVVIWERDTTDS